MRIKISLGCRGGTLPFNYNLFLAGVLYTAFRQADMELAQSIHVSKDIKLFTFSEIKGGRVVKNGLCFDRNAWFFVSSPRGDVLNAAVEGLLEGGEIRIGKVRFHLGSMEVLEPHRFDGGPVTFRTLSPINVTTKKEVGGVLKAWDLYPSDAKFYENIRKNLVRKFELFYSRPPEDDGLDMSPPINSRPVRIRIKDTFHRASHITFTAKGGRELLEMGFEAGFGEKNSMGFGMVEVVGESKEHFQY